MDAHQLSSCSEAMSNKVVLQNIFRFLPLEDLTSIRLVSNSWKNVARPIFQKKAAVTDISLERSVGDSDTEQEARDVALFLETFSKTPRWRVPYNRFSFNSVRFDSDSDMMDAFWDKFGPSVEYLTFNYVEIEGVETVRNILFKYCPNVKRICMNCASFYKRLQREDQEFAFHEEPAPVNENVNVNTNLTLFSVCTEDDEESSSLPINWGEIFIAFPNLEDLTICGINTKDTLTILEFANALKVKNPNGINWKKLTITGQADVLDITTTIIDRVLFLELSLEELAIDLGTGVTARKVAQLLLQQNNLKTLEIYQIPYENPMPGFPYGVVFNQLESLKIDKRIPSSMEFLKFMPRLTTLVIYDMSHFEEDTPIDPITNTDINFCQQPFNLTTVEIKYDVPTEDVRKLIYWFPLAAASKLNSRLFF